MLVRKLSGSRERQMNMRRMAYARGTIPLGCQKTENKMRGISLIVATVSVLTASPAIADEIDDAHKLALIGRDSYWNCLAVEYSLPGNKTMSGPDFTTHIADVCPSERQNFRVSLVDFLSLQYPNVDAGDHMTTANRAIALAQKDIVTAFIKHKAAAK
jgi:hypothetical protein